MRMAEEIDDDVHNTHSSSSSSSSFDDTLTRRNYPFRKPSSSSSSSSTFAVCLSTVCKNASSRTDLSTDLSLGLTISPSLPPKKFRDGACSDWPPIIKSQLRSTLGDNKQSHSHSVRVVRQSQKLSLFVKVYMEGKPIGRKLNLLQHHTYDGLVSALSHMFGTTILCPNDSKPLSSGIFHVLTYEDQEGDWMMVGDVPWEMFLSSVKRLKITRADRC